MRVCHGERTARQIHANEGLPFLRALLGRLKLLTTLFNLPARRDGVRARVMRMRKLNRILCKYGRVYPIYPPCAG